MSEPRDDELVWVAIWRRGITAHRPDGQTFTGCSRAMRTGEQLVASVARRDLAVLWCDQLGCWPPSTPVGA